MKSGKKLRVLIATGLYPPDIGGPATYSKLLFEELPKFGFSVEVLSFGEVRQMPKILRHISYFGKVLRRGRGADLIYAQDPVSVGLPSALAAKILGKRFILKVVGDYAWEQFQQSEKRKAKSAKFITPEEFQDRRFGFLTELRRRTERWTANAAEKVIVPSLYLKKIVQMWGVDGNKIRIVYNAFNIPEMATSKDEARRRLGWSGTVLLSAGRLVSWKGFALLIDIMPGILKEIPDVHLIIAGSGPDESMLRSRIRRGKLEGHVILVGSLTHQEILMYLRGADLFVLNTGYEGLSHQLLEAMASEIPIVTTKVGGNTELITDKESGRLIPFNDADQIKDAILVLCKDKVLRSLVVKNAKLRSAEFEQGSMLRKITEELS
ncbi:MAG: glycosyltransferase family 4 protein [Candidatus Niyogibacteria bacterium]|nr:glycosyltransferase family 4 protein [Candidatus Niyogibacteria bacterium]